MITESTYCDLTNAYAFFNEQLFSNSLPDCLITYKRKNRAYGYFCGQRFVTRDGADITDEIALNPSHFLARTTEEILSTLVHEMAHQWQHHEGSPSRSGYHNREWADKMISVGLMPSQTGLPGGRETGPKVTHYIVEGGPFDIACAELIARGINVHYVERTRDSDAKKSASKTRYECPNCSVRAWAKPGVKLICDECQIHLVTQSSGLADAPGMGKGVYEGAPVAAI
jgi:predicted SprT family Zn-dependent metalloprotease